jgi:hypothetical protein
VKVMTLIKTDESLLPPPQSLWDGMEKELPAIDAAITMVRSEGLAPSTVAATRVVSTGGRSTVLDGPFTEAKEVVGGYSICEVDTWEQAVEAARQFVAIHERHWPGWSGEAEVRLIQE